jgi:hypothetical protein
MSSLLRPLLTLAVLLALAAPAHADFGPGRGRPAPRSQEPRQDSALPDSVRRVEKQTGGEVLRAEPMQRDGREVYRLKVLTSDGRVRVMQDDPRDYRRDDRGDRRRGDRDSGRVDGIDAADGVDRSAGNSGIPPQS